MVQVKWLIEKLRCHCQSNYEYIHEKRREKKKRKKKGKKANRVKKEKKNFSVVTPIEMETNAFHIEQILYAKIF